MSSPILEKMGTQYPEGRKCNINSNQFLKKVDEIGSIVAV